MAEESVSSDQDQVFSIKKIYLKDMSFETPNSPSIFAMEEGWKPEINIQMSWASAQVTSAIYETVLSVTITAKHEDKTAYLVEVQQAGLFQIGGFSEEEIKPILGAFCPSQIFPFAREAVTNLVNKGGFPNLLLKPVNFDLAYQEQVAQAQQSGTQSEPIIN